jgi:phosphohistidine phosphatase SixA
MLYVTAHYFATCGSRYRPAILDRRLMMQRLSRIVWASTRILAGLVLLGIPALTFAGQLTGDTLPKLRGQALIDELRKGGHVVYFRHGTTAEVGEKDVADADLADCHRQRNLSPAGQAQTKAIGDAFRRLQIPVGDVYSSPYCRCLETARNIFGKVQQSKALHFAIHLRHTDRAAVTGQLLKLLGTPPPRGQNIALVSHTANLQDAIGLWPKPEGVAHIFRPNGDGSFGYVGMVLPEEWTALARRAPSSRTGFLSGLIEWLGGSR